LCGLFYVFVLSMHSCGGSAVARQADLLRSGVPVLAGWSRKSALGAALAQGDKIPEPSQRQAASVAAALMAVDRGASVVRVHDVKPTVDALKIWLAMQQQGGCPESSV
jgi:dihydropteroate synthase